MAAARHDWDTASLTRNHVPGPGRRRATVAVTDSTGGIMSVLQSGAAAGSAGTFTGTLTVRLASAAGQWPRCRTGSASYFSRPATPSPGTVPAAASDVHRRADSATELRLRVVTH